MTLSEDRLFALIPLVALVTWFLGGVVVFAIRTALRGLDRHEQRVEQRRSLLGPFLSYYLLWLIRPVEQVLIRARVAPASLTLLSLLLSAASAAALATGLFGLGGWLFIFNGIADLFDGRVARATGRATRAGAFADSVADRVAEGLVFSGLAWHFRTSWVLAPVLLGLVSSFVVSYSRARGESLDAAGSDVGMIQRPERAMILGTGMVFAPLLAALEPGWFGEPWTAIAALLIIAVTSTTTAFRRYLHVYGVLRDSESDRDDDPGQNEMS